MPTVAGSHDSFLVLKSLDSSINPNSEWAKAKKNEISKVCECPHWIWGTHYFVASCLELPPGFEVANSGKIVFDVDLVYYNNERLKSPLGIVTHGPYEKATIDVGVIYVHDSHADVFKSILKELNKHIEGLQLSIEETGQMIRLGGAVEVNFHFLRAPISDFSDPNAYKYLKDLTKKYDVLVIVHNRLDDKTYGNLKLKNILERSHMRVSRVQIVDVQKLKGMGLKYVLINLFHAIHFKGGITPYHISVRYSGIAGFSDKTLRETLFVGIALGRIGEGYLKGVASIMAGDFKVVTYIESDLHLKGKSQELSQDELERFVALLSTRVNQLEDVYRWMNRSLRHIVIFRSRKPNKAELELFSKLVREKGSSLRRGGRIIWIISWTKLKPESSNCRWAPSIGEVYHLPIEKGREYQHGVILAGVKYNRLQLPARLEYHIFPIGEHKGVSWEYAYAFYEVARRLHVTNPYPLNKSIPAPVKYARNFIKWYRRMMGHGT